MIRWIRELFGQRFAYTCLCGWYGNHPRRTSEYPRGASGPIGCGPLKSRAHCPECYRFLS